MKKSNQDQCIVAGVAAAAVVVAERSESEEEPPAYLKLIADCWEHIFDYLSFRDILRMGQTCKRMNRMAGFYLREYYPQIDFKLCGGKVYSQGVYLQTEFYPFISRLDIDLSVNDALEFLSNVNKFDALKTIKFNIELSETRYENMLNALKNVENIEMHACKIVGNVYEKFANCCPKLKKMKVFYSTSNDALLFSQHYPNLESLRFYPTKFSRVDELKTFLENHLKLKQFHVRFEFLWANRDVLIQSNIQLDLLNVHFFIRTDPFNEFVEFLKTLYGRNFFKTVQLSFYAGINNIVRDHMSHAISSLPQLKKLCTLNDSNLDLCLFINLKELQIQEFDHTTTNSETLAKSLPKLEQLVIAWTHIESILPFVRHSKNLKEIKIFHLRGSGLDLSALNNERKKLENACQVTIYTTDDIYLYPKWKSHNFKLELDLVKIARLDSIIWNI